VGWNFIAGEPGRASGGHFLRVELLQEEHGKVLEFHGDCIDLLTEERERKKHDDGGADPEHGGVERFGDTGGDFFRIRVGGSDGRKNGDQAGDGLVASAWSLTGSLAFAVVIAIVKWPPDFPDTLNGIGSMFGLALISTVIASMGFFLGVRHLGPASAALVATTEPVLTLIWVVIIFGDSLKAIQLLGAALVIIGVVWSQRTPKGFTTGDPDESHLTRA
jgi:uncharacterized membrane protein